MRLVLAALLALLCLAPPAAAQSGRRPDRGVQWSVGMGVIASPRPYEGADTEIMPVPVLGLRAGPFFFETVRMGVRFASTEHFKADVLAQARFEGYEEDDAKILAGMEERRMSADAGLRFMGQWRHLETELTALTDVLSRHDGHEIALGFGFPIREGGWTITPGVAARWQSDELADYYYGVTPAEAIAGRPAYAVEEALHPRAELKFRKPFARRKWTFLGQIANEWLDSEVRDSPIVDASSTLGGYVAIIRTFD